MANNLSVSTFYQSYFKDSFNRVKEIGLNGLDKAKRVFFSSLDTYLQCHDVLLEGIRTRIFTKRTNARTDLLPTAAILGLGFLTIPSFRIGIIPLLIEGGVILYVLNKIAKSPPPTRNTKRTTSSIYKKWLDSTHPFHLTVTGPILEELEYRGLLQNLILSAGGGSVPATLISAILFGLSHLDNDHAEAKFQAIRCAFTGISYGILNEHYGIFATIAPHITFNYIAELIDFYYDI